MGKLVLKFFELISENNASFEKNTLNNIQNLFSHKKNYTYQFLKSDAPSQK